MGAALVTRLLVGAIVALFFIIRIACETISFYWLRPRRIRMIMERQGVRGPNPRFLVGNIPEMAKLIAKSTANDMNYVNHNVVPRLLPHYAIWSKTYGKRFVFWNGTEPRLCVTDLGMINTLLRKYSMVSGKSWMQQQGVKHFIGRGLLFANGDEWYQQRHILAPAFTPHKLKRYCVDVEESTAQMIEKLNTKIREGRSEFEISEYLKQLTAEIISKLEFGPNFEKGKQIFTRLTDLQRLSAQASKHLCLPGSRFFPSKYNRQIKALKGEVDKSLMEIIQGRKDCVDIGRSDTHGQDFLGVLLDEIGREKMNGSSDHNGFHLNLEMIMDELKTFFFAGHDTTALLLSWTVMLLATNPLWQDKVRAEVKDVCGSDAPSSQHVSKFCVLSMVINESLRLYPSATLIPRMAFQDFQLGDLLIPKGLSIWIPVVAIHHNEELWGLDVNEFNPNRFATRVGGHFLPFGAGPRNCIGQAFALMEAKIILASLIQRFNFVISNNYRHAPEVVLTVRPKYGIQVILKPVTA
uniref:Cytochrome P450 n=1 Tax=Kalanchoe fedtschenkoi TaxID=63787 RepID=A0A7N0VLL5_KALFE